MRCHPTVGSWVYGGFTVAILVAFFSDRTLVPYILLAVLVVSVLFSWLALRAQSSADRRVTMRTVIVPALIAVLVAFIIGVVYGLTQLGHHH